MKNHLILTFLFLISSCALITLGPVHEEMAKTVEAKTYSYSVTDLKNKVIDHVKSGRELQKMIVFPTHPYQKSSTTSNDKAKEALNNGFIYKGKAYTRLIEINADYLANSYKQVKADTTNVPFNILESSENYFLIMKDNILYEAKASSLGKGKSVLSVYTLENLVEASATNASMTNVALSALNLIGKPIDLEASRKHQVHNRTEELRLYFKLEPKEANKMESELSARL